MKTFVILLAMVLVPGLASAQSVPLDSLDQRLEFVRPFVNHLLGSDVEASRKLLLQHYPAAAQNEQLLARVSVVMDRYGGRGYTVQGFRSAKGQDVRADVAGSDLPSGGGITIIYDPETGVPSGIAIVTITNRGG